MLGQVKSRYIMLGKARSCYIRLLQVMSA